MAKKKSSSKSKGNVSPKRKQPKPKSKPVPKSKSSPSKASKPSRNYTRTKTFKAFEKKFLEPKRLRNRSGKFTKTPSGKFKKTKAQAEYAKDIRKFWKQQYNVKGQSAKDVLKQVQKTFQQNTRNRFVKTRIPYWGKTAPVKKDGRWVKGKPKKRYLWKDKLTGRYLRGKQVGVKMIKAMEPVLIKNFMQKKGLKNYQKARKRFLKEIKNESLRTIIQLYGPY